MKSMRFLVLGLVAVAALAGCATGSRVAGSNGNAFASPASYEVARCDGWYDSNAGICDSMGD